MAKYIFFISGYLAAQNNAPKLINTLIDDGCEGVICATYGNKDLTPFKISKEMTAEELVNREPVVYVPSWNVKQMTENLVNRYQKWYSDIESRLSKRDKIIIIGHSL